MQIIFDEDDIKAALTAHATSMVTIKDDMEITIDMKAGRGENGYSATLNIQPKPAPVVGKTINRGTKAVEPAAVKPVSVSTPTKGLFSKPAAETKAPDPEPEAPPAEPEPIAAISTGEERGDPADTIQANLDEEPITDARAEVLTGEASADKPKSIFNFSKSAAAAGA